MEPVNNKAQKAQKIIQEMSNLSTLKWIGVAVLLHAAVILGSSYKYFITSPAPATENTAATLPTTAPAENTASTQNTDTTKPHSTGNENEANPGPGRKLPRNLTDNAPPPKGGPNSTGFDLKDGLED